MAWRIIIKTVKGRRYRYQQRSYRFAGKVKTESIYLGPEERTLPTEPDPQLALPLPTRRRDMAEQVAGLERDLRTLYAQAGTGPIRGQSLPPKPSADDFLDFGEDSKTLAERLATWQAEVDALNGQAKVHKAFDQVRAELEISEPGYRLITEDAHQHGGTAVHAVPSSFPQWLPDRLRRKKLFNRLLPLLNPDVIAYPARKQASRQRDLYQLILDRVDYLAGIDSAAIREKIMAAYGQSQPDNT